MEIDETFSSLEEIQTLLEKDGMTWRISVDDSMDDMENDDSIENDATCHSKIILESASFSADADTYEIEKWEAELPDVEEGDGEAESFGEETKNTASKTALEKAEVIYFDLFKKKTYTKTLIFQSDEENGSRVYRLIGFCEAPMF
ncbi:MAG: hypothetical protein LBE57_06245 [Methanosarcinales archaeon]|jgi:hypothetical protein|nr:hypothetical protein [Methanosarcinales archaeon]